jgi:hypothetical protein
MLVDPRLASVDIDRGKRFLDEPSGAFRARRLYQQGRGVTPHAIVFAPGSGKQQAEGRRGYVGGEVDNDVVAGHRAADSVRSEDVDLDRLCSLTR